MMNSPANPLLRYIEPEPYFAIPPENRTILPRFNLEIFQQFTQLFSDSELKHLKTLTHTYQDNLKKLTPNVIQKERERLTIELSWKSSQIEGNTYSLLDTEALIKDSREAPGHPKEEAQMILNHKAALDYIFSHAEHHQTLTVFNVETIHTLLTQHLHVDPGIRQRQVRIIGTEFQPLDNALQIRDCLEFTFKVVEDYSDPFHKALSAILLLSYIQPFMDGNKRTSRIIGNALLHAHGACSLSYRSVDSVEYKKAMLLFYEQNNVRYFKELFMAQYEFSVRNYFVY
jgi:Fic family protein